MITLENLDQRVAAIEERLGMVPPNDDTAHLQAAINSGGQLDSRRIYIVSESIHLPSDVVIEGNNAIIIAEQKPWDIVAHDDMGILNANRQKNVTIRNLTVIGVRGAGELQKTPKLIYLKACEDVVVEDCYFLHTNYEGLWGDCTRSTVRRCHFMNCGRGASDWVALPAGQFNGKQNEYFDNMIVRCGAGLGPNGDDCTMARNTIIDCEIGIGTGDSRTHPEAPCLIEDNFILVREIDPLRPTRGMYFTGVGRADNGGETTVRNNEIFVGAGHNCWGIDVTGNRDVDIDDNYFRIYGNALGISVQGSDAWDIGVTTAGNLFEQVDGGNGRAIAATPSNQRNVTVQFSNDTVQGFRDTQIVVDTSEYRGGIVSTTIEEMTIDGGYFRSPQGSMRQFTEKQTFSHG